MREICETNKYFISFTIFEILQCGTIQGKSEIKIYFLFHDIYE